MRHPLPPQYQNSISQVFGVNPKAYAAFGLLGHNGLDYAVPVGTPVCAIDDGTVAEVREDAGYGNYVKLVHPWGESLYAHLSAWNVQVGIPVSSGTMLGSSGNTGNSTGPHLHLGVRVAPYMRNDGWNGYVDPAVVLRQVGARTLAIGPHLAGPDVGSMVSEIARWKPPVVIYLDPSPDHVRSIKAASPETKIIGRIYRPDSEVADQIRANPQAAANWMDGIIRSHPAFGLCDYWQIANEVCQVQWNEFLNLCSCMEFWQEKARGSYGCAIFGFSVGNPDMPQADRLAYWRRTVPALEAAIENGNILLLHQYGARDMWGPDADWYANRWENQVFPRLGLLDEGRFGPRRVAVPTLKAIQVVCGEYGIDGLIYGEKKGWKGYTTAADYARQLILMASYTERWPGNIGYCVYTCGHASGEWASYDIWPDVAKLLADEAERLRAVQAPDVFEVALRQAAAAAQCIFPNPDAALQKAIYRDGYVPVSGEVRVVLGSVAYICQKADNLATGAARCYYCVDGDWGTVLWSPYKRS